MIMKTLISTLIATSALAGFGTPGSAAARNSETSANPYYAAPPSYERQVCASEAFEVDPSGQYAGYPCWARKAFAPRR